MFAAQRIKVIKDIMLKQKSVDIITLTKILEVSDVTVRKDLEKLEQEGFLIKNHGGAVIVETNVEEESSNFLIENNSEKEMIANLAYTLVDDGDSIFLGAGSTCYAFARKLKEKKNITLITNNINAVNELSPNIKIILLGGEIINKNGLMYSVGQQTVEGLKGIYVNKSFISIDGIDQMAGFTINDESYSAVLKHVLRMSKQLIVLADHNKFDKIGFYQVASLDYPNCIVSNDRLDDAYKQYFYEHDIKTHTAYNLE